jgi:membrane protease subunit HflK
MSLNDPQWGKRGRTGPPDLDEIWRNVVRRFNELFGHKDPIDAGDDGVRRSASCRWAAPASSLRSCSSCGWSAVLHRRRRPARGRHPLRQVHGDDPSRPALAPAVPIEAVDVIDFSQVKTVEIGYRNGNRRTRSPRVADAH